MINTSDLTRSYKRYALYEKGHTPNTVTQTLSILKRLMVFAQTDSIQQLTTPVIRDFLQIQREQKGWSAKTFRLYRQYLKTFFGWCIQEGIVARNPVTPINQPPLPILFLGVSIKSKF